MHPGVLGGEMAHHLKWIYPCWCDGTTIARSNKKRLYRAFLHSLSRNQVTLLASWNKMKLLPNNTFMWSFDTASKPLYVMAFYGVKLKIALGQDWLHQSGLRRKTGSNWFTKTKIENERKNWIVCTRIFGWIRLTWSGSVLKFSFQLRPAVCQNLIDIFHVLRNIQFNSDIKRPQCHWTLILISINMIRNWRGWGCLTHALLGACDEIAPSSHLQPGVPPASTIVCQEKTHGLLFYY